MPVFRGKEGTERDCVDGEREARERERKREGGMEMEREGCRKSLLYDLKHRRMDWSSSSSIT